MKDRAVTNPPHEIDSSNTQQVDVSRRDSEEDELLTSIPHEKPSIKEIIEGDGSEEELIQNIICARETDSIQYSTKQSCPAGGRLCQA